MTAEVVLHINQLAKKNAPHLEINNRNKSSFLDDDTYTIQDDYGIDHRNLPVSLDHRSDAHTAGVNDNNMAEPSSIPATAPTIISNHNNYFPVGQHEEDRSVHDDADEERSATTNTEDRSVHDDTDSRSVNSEHMDDTNDLAVTTDKTDEIEQASIMNDIADLKQEIDEQFGTNIGTSKEVLESSDGAPRRAGLRPRNTPKLQRNKCHPNFVITPPHLTYEVDP